MKAKLSVRSIVLLLSLLVALIVPFTVMAQDRVPPGVTLTPIGSPTWRPVDIHLFAAPLGTAASNYAEYTDTTLGLLPPPNHQYNQYLGVGPGVAHPPPYDTELAAGVAARGYHQGVSFHGAEFSNGTGVYIAFMNVPGPGATGTSPDFKSGPIIPNSIFPIVVNGIALRQGQLFDSFLIRASVPPLDSSIDTAFRKVEGHSHFPFFVADNADFGKTGQLLPGVYAYQFTMIDASGSGWKFDVSFDVTG
jgi:hypothetical protein